MAALGASAALAERGVARGAAARSAAEAGGCFFAAAPLLGSRAGGAASALHSAARRRVPRAAPALAARRAGGAGAVQCHAGGDSGGQALGLQDSPQPPRKLVVKPRPHRRPAEPDLPEPLLEESGGSASPVSANPSADAAAFAAAAAEAPPEKRIRRMRTSSVAPAAREDESAAYSSLNSALLPPEADEVEKPLLGLDFMLSVCDASSEKELRNAQPAVFPADYQRCFAGFSQLSRRQRVRARRPLLERCWTEAFDGAVWPNQVTELSEGSKTLGDLRRSMWRYASSKRALFRDEDRHINVELDYLVAWEKGLARRQDEAYREARRAAGLDTPVQYETATGVQRIGSLANAFKLAAGGAALPEQVPERTRVWRRVKDAVGLDCRSGTPARRGPDTHGMYTASVNPDIEEEKMWAKEDSTKWRDGAYLERQQEHRSRWATGAEHDALLPPDEREDEPPQEEAEPEAEAAAAPPAGGPLSVGERLRFKFQERRRRSLNRMKEHLPHQVAMQDELATPAEKRAAEVSLAKLGDTMTPAERRAADRFREGGTTKVMNEPLDIMQLLPGEVVVHKLNGVARFLGYREEQGPGGISLVLQFADSRAKLTSTAATRLLYRYNSRRRPLMADSEMGRKVKLSKLKDPSVWLRQQAKEQVNVNKLVMHVMDVYLQRIMLTRPPYPEVPADKYDEFAAGFKYPLTPDQQSSVEDIYQDMSRETPMDRLVVGDVGFGKTEVAMRAVLRAVLAGKQVLVLAPTTVLARQHSELFGARFKAIGIDCGFLTRFTSAGQRARLRGAMANGTQRLVVGTHAIITDAELCPNLGLLVVDEEQRFGVKQKERITQLLSTLDVLTLSATPIPRTLHMAMSGFRDASLIASPPPGRRPIETEVIQTGGSDEATIVKAVTRELERGGQVFYVTPKIEQQAQERARLLRLLPNLRIETANGQMDADKLDETMDRFSGGHFDLLLCTTIVESGLDMPRVNTIIIIDAQQFGLASLYQLRGRVGRNDQQAYAFLFYSTEGLVSKKTDDDDDAIREEERLLSAISGGRPDDSATQPAPLKAATAANAKARNETALRVERRMNAIRQANALGGGFQLSGEDMNIRGVGSVFGSKQSGGESALGMDLYMEMLYAALANVEKMRVPVVPFEEVQLPFPAFLPPPLPRGMFSAEDSEALIESAMEAGRAGPDAMRSLLVRLQDVMEGPVAFAVETMMNDLALRWYASQMGVSTTEHSAEKGRMLWGTGMTSEAFDIISSLITPLLRDEAREMFDFPAPLMPRSLRKKSRDEMTPEEQEADAMDQIRIDRQIERKQNVALKLARDTRRYQDEAAAAHAASVTPLAVLRALYEVTPNFMRYM